MPAHTEAILQALLPWLQRWCKGSLVIPTDAKPGLATQGVQVDANISAMTGFADQSRAVCNYTVDMALSSAGDEFGKIVTQPADVSGARKLK